MCHVVQLVHAKAFLMTLSKQQSNIVEIKKYDSQAVDTGKKHWQTKEAIKKPSMIHNYNKYMGAVDFNDQLL